MPLIEEDPGEGEDDKATPEINQPLEQPSIRDQFELEIGIEYAKRLKKLSTSEKFYLYLRRYYVVDILFTRSPEHL